MKPNLRIKSMTNEKLVEALQEEMIAVGGQRYGDKRFMIPTFNKRSISMLRTELLNRLEKSKGED